MEENKTTEQKEQKLSYEQLEQVAMQLQQKLMQAENNFNSINMTTLRLTYLFKVIENSAKFTEEFVQKCVDEVMTIMEIKEEPEVKTEDSKE